MLHKIQEFIQKMQIETLKPFGKNLPEHALKIQICERNKEIAQVFASVFADEDRVEIVYGDVLHCKADAVVSPANSFGDMGGGLDKALDDFFEGQAQKAVQQRIQIDFFGELPVGTATIIAMHNHKYPWLIVAPTMRIPGNVAQTINAYLAMRAVLVATLNHNASKANPIKTLVLSSFCTGVGGMPYQEAAEQMLTALRIILDDHYRKIVHPAMAAYNFRRK
jgi:O-acetyl-ADP-ribose deacetylase (regulator of RNase III)